MRERRQQLLSAALLGVFLLVTAACEDSPPTADKDWTLLVTADPATLELPTENDFGESTITASLYDANGLPKSGIGLRFSADAGSMKSGGKAVKTDGSGVAKDVLVTRDPAKVTVSSGSVSDTVVVKVNAGTAPTAVITFSPANSASIGTNVLISGSQSEDMDGNIDRYDWIIYSTVPSANEVVENGGQALNRIFTEPMTINVTLKVTDDSGATATTTSSDYYIYENLPPTVEAGGDQAGNKVQDSPYVCAITLSACSASDPDGRVVAYEFHWGNGDTAPSTACTQNHTYSAAGQYRVDMIVWDNGDAFNLSSPPVPTCNQPPPALCPTRKSGSDYLTVTCPS